MTLLASAAWLGLDGFVAALLFPVAVAILISGVDDLIVDVVWAWAWLRGRFRRRGAVDGPQDQPAGRPEKRIAVFVPLWHEHAVIGGMLEHNVAAINYDNYHFFIGAYPNDERTLDAVRDLENRFPHVHLAVCPHDGPTSKADCLNWIYQRLLLFEEQQEGQFDIVITHDAEDLIHPDAFSEINIYADEFEMVQIPVLALRRPLPGIVSSIYCDEFAEWQIKDMPVRKLMGSFVPSNGVGTGYRRDALKKLATAKHNLIFEPGCLTEDYENGLRLHKLGCKQVFVPLSGSGSKLVATREFFPRTVRTAVQQRTRWITGIGLQSWERHGWRGSWPQIYWFWRDRKGLLGNPLSLLANCLFLYGALTWIYARWSGGPWGLSNALHPSLVISTLSIQIVQSAVRIGCAARLYGILFALGAPLRAMCANWINSMATFRAVHVYFRARALNEPLVWLKTEHAYPSRGALAEHKRKLGEVLAGSGYLLESDVDSALESQPLGMRLGEYLVSLGKITEAELYEALSLQHSLPAGRVDPWVINTNVARALPRQVVREWQVLPIRVASGNLFLASPEIPTDERTRILREYTHLTLRFHLVTPDNFIELTDRLL